MLLKERAWMEWTETVYREYQLGNMTTEEWLAFTDEAFEMLLTQNEDVLVQLKNI